MSVLNKIAVCIFCSETACCVGACEDIWISTEAYGLCCLNCGACCWTIFAPICHKCELGNFSKGMDFFVKGAKYCLVSAILDCVAPVDGIINCVLYTVDNCKNSVNGFSDVTKNSKFIGEKVRNALDAPGSSEPSSTFGSYTP